MNRTERLYAVREELHRAGTRGTTSARLARLLEVSERTIKRDVSALQQAGVPVWAQAGPGGGYVLDGSATLPPVNFTPSQAVSVAVALAALPDGSPFGVDGAAARGKVWDALAPADRRRAADLIARVWFDAAARGGGEPAVEARTLRAVEQSIAGRQVLALRYRASGGTVSRRSVEPVLLARAENAWYLVAWCRLRQDVRWFRLSRVERADLRPERYEPRDPAEVGPPPVGARPAG